jgi:hypothetical protein
MRFGHSNQIVPPKAEMKSGLVTQMFDPLHETILSFALNNVLGT